MAEHYDALETRDPAVREAAQFAQLRAVLAEARERAPALAERVDAAAAAGLTDRAALARLPVLRKSDLLPLQQAAPPLGGLAPGPAGGFAQVFQSPGPIYEPGMASRDWWRMARALFAAGLRAGDVLLNSFAYHLTPAGHMLENGAQALGATVIPGGTGNSEGQARAASAVGASAYAGTPDFLATILEKADALGLPLRIARALVSGGPLFPAVREGYTARGIACLQCYATADVGLIAYETAGEGGPNPGMVVDEGVILEILRPGTGDPVPAGEVGEVAVTALNPDYPLVRFATGDLSAVLEGRSPCGRTGLRIKGWMGRADQTTKVKGMFVRPEQIAEIARRHPEIGRARLTVERAEGHDRMILQVETERPDPAFAAAVAETVQAVLSLSGKVEAVLPGSLPNDGKVIEDAREHGPG